MEIVFRGDLACRRLGIREFPLFGVLDAQVAAISNEWRATLARLFPPSPGK